MRKLIKQHGSIILFLFGVVLFAWFISVREYIYYREIVGLICTALLTGVYTFVLNYYSNRK